LCKYTNTIQVLLYSYTQNTTGIQYNIYYIYCIVYCVGIRIQYKFYCIRIPKTQQGYNTIFIVFIVYVYCISIRTQYKFYCIRMYCLKKYRPTPGIDPRSSRRSACRLEQFTASATPSGLVTASEWAAWIICVWLHPHSCLSPCFAWTHSLSNGDTGKHLVNAYFQLHSTRVLGYSTAKDMQRDKGMRLPDLPVSDTDTRSICNIR